MKTWIKTNLSKITLALALTGATTGTIGLIMGGMLTHNVSGVKYYLTPHKQVEWGVQTIWTTNPNDTLKKDYKFELYFADEPLRRKFDISFQNWYYSTDIVWNGKYPNGYFNK
ncbi:MAG: hypothetical protein H9Q66_00755 [Spiroplasma ixodetis]|nr:hypothetical protein [Spiroplasma ixodetis]